MIDDVRGSEPFWLRVVRIGSAFRLHLYAQASRCAGGLVLAGGEGGTGGPARQVCARVQQT